jgi:glucose-1-phosphate thymidylyltransferase
VACIEEVAYRMGYISAVELETLAQKLPNDYGSYLKMILREPETPGLDNAPV